MGALPTATACSCSASSQSTLSRPEASPTCATCGVPRSSKNKTGLCRKCAAAVTGRARRIERRTECIECGGRITRQSKTGRCRVCASIHVNKTDELKLKRAEGIRRKFQDPEHRAKMAKVAIRNGQKGAADPEHHAWLVRRGYELTKILQSPEVRARNQSPECRARAGRSVSETRMAWCPKEYWEDYRFLVRSKRMLAADARRMIEQKIADRQALKDIDEALYFLRKFAPVAKLEDGFRYGNAILSPAEVIERAKTRGWQPDRWAA